MLIIPKIKLPELSAPADIFTCMKNLPLNRISCVNWPENYPSCPEAGFKIAHNGSYLFLHYFIEENEILAQVGEDNGQVWNDSCVEFFISFDNTYYYNHEFSCIGKTLLGYRKERSDSVHSGQDLLDRIKRYPSLGTETFGIRKGLFKWDILVVIPVSVYWQSGFASFDNIGARANFYKCGDSLDTPHYLSWQRIDTEKPDFHRPEFFGEIYFE